jgi:hypothetical protein
MIGVIANPSEHPVVAEFFELFKTPWEFYQSGRRYEVLLCAWDGDFPKDAAGLILIYSGQKSPFDAEEKIEVASARKNGRFFLHHKARLPIYGDSLTFGKEDSALVDEESQQSAIDQCQLPTGRILRIGYNLFDEVRRLLTDGQLAANAAIPALDRHIALLRELIVANGASLVEIPPVPRGYRFIACLTHDLDHPSLRRHKFDHAMFGFLYRAIFGSALEVVRGRASFSKLGKNWAAALKLPFIYLGWAKDPWLEFERYAEIETGAASTFFVIPFADNPGRTNSGFAPGYRAARYGIADIADVVRRLAVKGSEIGLHGIDAWLDGSKGREELEQIRQVIGEHEIGVRMHWLYRDGRTPATLESAGASYDSTIGYNETVGYRSGTTQAYKPFGTSHLLELPLHVMDTALFFPGYLNLSQAEARTTVSRIVDHARHFGGAVVVNWHDRSLAPERLWDDFYIDLVAELKNNGAWFATAGGAVGWFRKRRSAVFETTGPESRPVVAGETGKSLPGLQLCVYNQREHEKAAVTNVPSETAQAFEQQNSAACTASLK